MRSLDTRLQGQPLFGSQSSQKILAGLGSRRACWRLLDALHFQIVLLLDGHKVHGRFHQKMIRLHAVEVALELAQGFLDMGVVHIFHVLPWASHPWDVGHLEVAHGAQGPCAILVGSFHAAVVILETWPTFG